MCGMAEQNLANSYRPSKYSEVVGQSIAVSTLKRISSAEGIACRALFMKGAYGSGKCVHPDTVVRTDDGLRLAKDIVGGESFSICGNENSFVASAINADTDIYIIQTERGKEIRVTGNHPVMVWRPKDGYLFVKASELSVGDTVVEDCTPVCYSGELDEWCYLAGLAVAGGALCFSATRRSCVISSGDPYVIEECSRLLKSHYVSHSVTPGGSGTTRFTLSTKSNLHLWLEEQGLAGCMDDAKPLPRDFYRWSFVQQVSFVQGIFDVDGSYTSKKSVLLTERSLSLLRGVQCVVSALGYPTRIVRQDAGVSRSGRSAYSSTNRLYVYSYSPDGEGVDRLFRSPAMRERARLSSVYGLPGLKFKGAGDMLADYISRKGIVVPPAVVESMYSLCRQSSFGTCMRWSDWLVSEGYYPCVILPHTVPDVVEKIERGTCSHTIDLQCSDAPIFFTDGLVTHNTTLSRIFAKSMNCDHFKSSGDVCGECAGCLEASALNSSLYWELDGTVVGNVEGIRNLKERLSIVPQGRRVVVLDEVQAISQAAADALLKIVEEGVPSTIFVFCGTEDIRPALRSRCVNIDISVIPLPLIEEHISRIAASRGLGITPEEVKVLAMRSGGHMRDALQLLQFYELAGSAALESSYFKLREFVAACFVKGGQPLALLSELLLYGTADIRSSVGVLLRSIYTAAEGSLEHKMQKAGLGRQLFGFFFSPVAQQAMGSEVGMEVLLRSLVEKTAGSR